MRLSLVLLGTLCSGCVQFTYLKVERFAEPGAAAVGALEVGQGLAECVDLLGAPFDVLERETDPGLVLVYAWERASGWALSFSSPSEDVPVSLDVGRSEAGLDALVLWIDGADRLERFERGTLAAALAQAPRRLGR